MARRRFFVDEIHHRQAVVSGEEALHMRQVFRAERGQRYELSDGVRVFLAEIVDFRKETVTFDVLEEIPQAPDLLRVSICAALIKFDRFELLIEKATELGATKVVPFAAIRSEKGMEKAVPKRRERWQRIAMEAAKQCHRVNAPEVAELASWRRMLAEPAGLRYFLDEEGEQPILSALPPLAERTQGTEVTVLVGPEGGWDPRERQQALDAGFVSLSLGRRILRAETAAIAALSALQLAWEQALSANTLSGD
ncbi:MAG: 16S rRNA (uracil(1498)-N(3))-methyltransferase [Bryobacterales bacterium]|nr:16S rRNA (uracil(1498)-N(3))-methyltransferase [Bryobacterales bacterium]